MQNKFLQWGIKLQECVVMCRKLGGGDFRLIYRHYATLYFVFCVDAAESELGILDLIQVLLILSMCWTGFMPRKLQKYHFPGVCGNS